jgi:hypothetical protein
MSVNNARYKPLASSKKSVLFLVHKLFLTYFFSFSSCSLNCQLSSRFYTSPLSKIVILSSLYSVFLPPIFASCCLNCWLFHATIRANIIKISNNFSVKLLFLRVFENKENKGISSLSLNRCIFNTKAVGHELDFSWMTES